LRQRSTVYRIDVAKPHAKIPQQFVQTTTVPIIFKHQIKP
jgi:hypothetical protein